MNCEHSKLFIRCHLTLIFIYYLAMHYINLEGQTTSNDTNVFWFEARKEETERT